MEGQTTHPGEVTAGERVAVIIPCYNSSRYVAQAIRSVLRQDYAPIEIIAVDDGSPDNLACAIEPFGDRVRLLAHDRNHGIAAARNTGIDATDAPLLAFLDPDDRWLESKIRRQVEYLRAHPECGLVYVGRSTIDAIGRPATTAMKQYVPISGYCWEALLRGCHILSSQVMVRRAVLGADRFLSEASPIEDWDLWLRLATRTPFGRIEHPLTEWRQHDQQASRSQDAVRAGILRMLLRTEAQLTLGAARDAVRVRIGEVRALMERREEAPALLQG
jgi:glycosyltransferase involved in cell wall biosynthesis